MNGELYLKKGMLQLNKKLYDEALETLNKVIELDDDLASVTSAKCILGEYYFIHQNYEKSKEFYHGFATDKMNLKKSLTIYFQKKLIQPWY